MDAKLDEAKNWADSLSINNKAMNKDLEKTLGKIESEIKNNKNISPAFDNPEELFEYLDAAK